MKEWGHPVFSEHAINIAAKLRECFGDVWVVFVDLWADATTTSNLYNKHWPGGLRLCSLPDRMLTALHSLELFALFPLWKNTKQWERHYW